MTITNGRTFEKAKRDQPGLVYKDNPIVAKNLLNTVNIND